MAEDKWTNFILYGGEMPTLKLPKVKLPHISEDISRGAGDPDFYGYPGMKKQRHWIGEDKPKVVIIKDAPLHWSLLPKSTYIYPPREFGDNNKLDPEQNWEDELGDGGL